MKIGVLTYFWDENPGTLLQAYCLVNAVAETFFGDRVELINYQHLVSRYRCIRNYFKYRYALNDLVRLRRYRKFKRKHLIMGQPALVSQDLAEIVNFLNDSNYDLIIVGSDTVWQISRKKDRPSFPNIYWVPVEVDSLKVAYAVSSNKTAIADLSDRRRDAMSDILDGFGLIGVRDTMSKALVEGLTSRFMEKVSQVPDPTFLRDIPHVDVESIVERRGIRISNDPILGLNYPNNDFCKKIISHYKNRGFSVISLAENPHADLSLPCLDPFAWANMYRLFSLVITDRFHGTVFSLKHLKPVISIDWSAHRFDKEGNSKLRFLLKEFDLDETNHFNIKGIERDIPGFLKKAIYAEEKFDRESVSRKLSDMRLCGKSYLEKIYNFFRTETKKQK